MSSRRKGSRRGSSKGKRSGSKSSRGSRRSKSAKSSDALVLSKEASALFDKGGKEYGVNGTLRVHADAIKEREVVHKAIMGLFSLQPSTPGTPLPSNVIIGIITSAPIETIAVVQKLTSVVAFTVPAGVSVWNAYVGSLEGVRVVVVKSDQGPSGSHGSFNAAAFLCNFFGVRAVWAVGIALGADPDNQIHGDPLVASAVQLYETREKVIDGKKTIALSLKPFKAEAAIASVSQATSSTWSCPTSGSRPARAHLGLVVSAARLLDDADATKQQLDVVRKAVTNIPVIGGEMEMSGVISACASAGVPWGMVKSICDFGGLDARKTKEHQPLAACSAIDWLASAIKSSSWAQELPLPVLRALRVLNFDTFVSFKTTNFVGRADLFARVNSWREDANSGPVLLVKGDPGLGKTAFLAQLTRNSSEHLAAVHFCRYDEASTLNARIWLGSVVKQVLGYARRSGVKIDQKSLEPILDQQRSVADAWCQFVQQLPRDGPSDPAIIVLDSLDEAHDAGGRDGDAIIRAVGRSSHPKILPKWLKIIASTRKDEAVIRVLERHLQAVSMEASSAENQADVREYITRYGEKMSEASLDALIKASGGNFLYTRQVLADGDVEERISSGELPNGLRALYSDRARVLWKTGSEFQGDLPVLHVLVAGLAPIPKELLGAAAALSGLKGSTKVSRVLSALSSVLEEGEDGSVRVFHKSFVDWCVEEGWSESHRSRESFVAEPEIGHGALAQAGLSAWAKGGNGVTDYVVKHTLAHLAFTHNDKLRHEALNKMALKWDWLEAKAGLDGWRATGDQLEQLGGVAHNVGTIVKQWMYGGSSCVADGLAMHTRNLEGAVMLGEETRGIVSAWPMVRNDDTNEALEYRLIGHSGRVPATGFTADGTLLTGSEDRTIRAWDAKTGECIRVFNGHTNVVEHLVALPGTEDGFASISTDRSVRTWSLNSPNDSSLQDVTAHGEHDMFPSLTVVDENTLVSCANDRALIVYKKGGDGKWAYDRHLIRDVMFGALCIATYPTGADGVTRVVAGGGEKILRVYQVHPPVKEGQTESALEGHTHVVSGVAVFNDGRTVSGSWDNTVRVWSAKRSGAAEMVLEGHSKYVADVAVFPDNRRIASGSGDSTIRLWDAPAGGKGVCLAVLRGHASHVLSLAVSPTGLLLSGSRDNTAAVWDPEAAVAAAKKEKGKSKKKASGSLGDVEVNGAVSAVLLPDGRVVTGSRAEDRTVHAAFQQVNGSLIQQSTSSGGSGDLIVWSAGDEDTVPKAEQVLPAPARWPSTCMTRTKKGFATSGNDMSVTTWVEKSGKWTASSTVKGHGHWVLDLKTLPDGSTLVSASRDGSVGVWDSNKGKMLKKLDGHGSRVSAVAGVTNTEVASGDEAGKVFHWTWKNGKHTALPGEHQGPVTGLLSVNGGKGLVSSSDAGAQMWYWDLEKKTPPVPFGGLKGTAYIPVAEVGDGKFLARPSLTATTVEVWSWKKLERVRVLVHVERAISTVLWDEKKQVVTVVAQDGSWMSYNRLVL